MDPHHLDADPDPDPSFQIKGLLKYRYISTFHLQIDTDSVPVLDPAYHFDADPDGDADHDF